MLFFFFFQAEDGIRDSSVTGVQTCALPICLGDAPALLASWCRKNAGPTSGAQRCPVITSASETTRLGIHECAAGPSGPAGGSIVERNLRLCGCRSVVYLRNHYDAGVPPAPFFVHAPHVPP